MTNPNNFFFSTKQNSPTSNFPKQQSKILVKNLKIICQRTLSDPTLLSLIDSLDITENKPSSSWKMELHSKDTLLVHQEVPEEKSSLPLVWLDILKT